MIFPEYEQLDAVALAELIRKGELSAEEALEAALARLEARNPRLNAVIDRLEDFARKAIADGLPEGPLRGVPFLFKEILSWEGHTLTLGSNLLRDNLADETAPVAQRLLDAGLVVFGRTNTPELGLLPITESSLYGPAHNPWNLDYSPGGSSGGSAAAVAARILPVAHANDGGGSIRGPAAACGLFGLKASKGRNPSSSLEPPDGYTVEGCVSRSVRDSATILDAIHGANAGDRFWAPPPKGSFLAAAAEDPPKLRIAFSTTDFTGARAHADCRSAVEKTAALCESLGHEVVEARPAVDGDAYNDAFQVLWCTAAGVLPRAALLEIEKGGAPRLLLRLLEQRPVLKTALRAMTLKTGLPPLEPFTRLLVDLEEKLTPASAFLAWQAFDRAHHVLADFLGDHDLYLTPTFGEPTWRTGYFDQTASFDTIRAQLLRYVAYTPIANTSGFPAMSVPLHWNAAGLPIGVHFLARFGEEETLYSLAGQLERAQGWTERLPPMLG